MTNTNTTPTIPDTLIEQYTGAGCTLGRCHDTKFIQVVHVKCGNNTIKFLYRGGRRGAFEEVRRQFDGFRNWLSDGNTICLYFTPDQPAEVVARVEELPRYALSIAARDWYINKTCFPSLPLALPAIGTPDTTPAAQTIAKPYPPCHTAATFKTKYPEHIILYRVGDFYEAFDDDARTIAHITGLTLINKTDTDGTRFSLVGFPYHQIDSYLPRLVRHGHKVAICDELTAPTHTTQRTAATPTPSQSKNSDMLQDWGEKIGGARKDEAQQHTNTTTDTPAVKKLKYGLTCRRVGLSTGEKVTRWYLKTSPARYSTALYIDYEGQPLDSDIFRKGEENTRQAEQLFIQKYPYFDNYYKFDIFQIGYKSEYIVEAKRLKIRLRTFDSLTAAREYMNTEQPLIDLEEAKAARDPQQTKRAAALVVRNSINRPRLGTDHAKGRNITPEELATRFGLRAIEFGNWMNADDRQTSINECYSSFCTLAELLQIPTEKIGRGTLAIAFGARGTGKANAHYEPDRHVINLTRTRGAGSLAHEWAHSIDSADGRRHHLSSGFYFGGYSSRSKRAGSYWGSEHEQFARAFETAIHYKMKYREVVDDYLVNIIEECPVYPTALEIDRIAAYVIEKIKSAL